MKEIKDKAVRKKTISQEKIQIKLIKSTITSMTKMSTVLQKALAGMKDNDCNDAGRRQYGRKQLETRKKVITVPKITTNQHARKQLHACGNVAEYSRGVN